MTSRDPASLSHPVTSHRRQTDTVFLPLPIYTSTARPKEQLTRVFYSQGVRSVLASRQWSDSPQDRGAEAGTLRGPVGPLLPQATVSCISCRSTSSLLTLLRLPPHAVMNSIRHKTVRGRSWPRARVTCTPGTDDGTSRRTTTCTSDALLTQPKQPLNTGTAKECWI